MALCEIRNLRKTYTSFTLSELSFQLNAGRLWDSLAETEPKDDNNQIYAGTRSS